MATKRFVVVVLILHLVSSCQCRRPQLAEGDMVAVAPALVNADLGIQNINHWPGNVIPFQFSPGYPNDLKHLFHRATEHIAERTCLRFKPRKDENDYVNVIQGNGCWSFVGRIQGGQNMSLPYDCEHLGTFVHELLHAVGFQHEQARLDRDKYVKILWDNISEDKKKNFDRHTMELGTRYDYNRVMHYSRKAFSKNHEDTIVPKYKGAMVGFKNGLSRGDVWEINKKFYMLG